MDQGVQQGIPQSMTRDTGFNEKKGQGDVKEFDQNLHQKGQERPEDFVDISEGKSHGANKHNPKGISQVANKQ